MLYPLLLVSGLKLVSRSVRCIFLCSCNTKLLSFGLHILHDVLHLLPLRNSTKGGKVVTLKSLFFDSSTILIYFLLYCSLYS